MESTQPTEGIALDAYLARIGYDGPLQPTVATLTALHEHHTAAIPFENFDVRLGRPIRLDLASLQAKLVDARRGGYCFEQNTLFAAMLRRLGFQVTTLEARVRPPGATRVTARTHMTLRVDVDGREWLADVGFGGAGPRRPVAQDGTLSQEAVGTYQVAVEGALRVLRLQRAQAWRDLYAFGPEPALPIDYEVANHYTATYPESIFVRSPTLQLSLPGERHALRGHTLTIQRGEDEETREVSTEEALELVRGRFGLDLSDAEILRALQTDP